MARIPEAFALALAAVIVLGCGSASSKPIRAPSLASDNRGNGRQQTATALRRVAPTSGYLRDDGDRDGDEEGEGQVGQGDDAAGFARYARADAADATAIAKLVKRYYAAALAGNSARACSLLSAAIAAGLPLEQQAQAARRAGSAGDSCATAIGPLLMQQHGRLAAEDAQAIVVFRVYVKRNVAFAVVGFRTHPEAQIALERERGHWKIDALFDSPLT